MRVRRKDRHSLDTTDAIPLAEIRARLGRPPQPPARERPLSPWLYSVAFIIGSASIGLAYNNADAISRLVGSWVSW